jgi:NAD(P)-dependent dehydrogenase (short-subunit alcohol dehydrogenase family)
MKKVLITGATGATGGNAIEKLLELKVPVRALVHKVDERSEKLSSQGVEIFQGDLSDFEAVSEALKGITAAYYQYRPLQAHGGWLTCSIVGSWYFWFRLTASLEPQCKSLWKDVIGTKLPIRRHLSIHRLLKLARLVRTSRMIHLAEEDEHS